MVVLTIQITQRVITMMMKPSTYYRQKEKAIPLLVGLLQITTFQVMLFLFLTIAQVRVHLPRIGKPIPIPLLMISMVVPLTLN